MFPFNRLVTDFYGAWPAYLQEIINGVLLDVAVAKNDTCLATGGNNYGFSQKKVSGITDFR